MRLQTRWDSLAEGCDLDFISKLSKMLREIKLQILQKLGKSFLLLNLSHASGTEDVGPVFPELDTIGDVLRLLHDTIRQELPARVLSAAQQAAVQKA